VIATVCFTLSLLHAIQAPAPAALSPFARAKAEALIHDRLPCLGCHELDGKGGHIGPSFDDIGSRTTRPEYVEGVIRDPQLLSPGTMMPRIPMSPATLHLVATYLVQHRPSQAHASASPLLGTRAPDSTSTLSPAALYGHLCASCHGKTGGGDGPNARYLPVRPTAHADSAYMSSRTDDDLFDTIFAGGYVMNRSNRMPPFGATLSRPQIHALVGYLRSLCRCAGPIWSRNE